MTQLAHDLTEHEFTAQLVELATTLGYKRYHTYRSKRSPVGFPDEVLVRERVIFAELKREDGKPTPDQIVWLTALARAGAEVYLWRPSDLDEIARVLGGRWSFMRLGANDYVLYGARGHFTPNSLWLPAGHRADQAPAATAA